MATLLKWYVEAINKPRMYQTISDELIILLVPCLIVIAMIVIFCTAVWIIKKIISFVKKIQEREEARLEAAMEKLEEEEDEERD